MQTAVIGASRSTTTGTSCISKNCVSAAAQICSSLRWQPTLANPAKASGVASDPSRQRLKQGQGLTGVPVRQDQGGDENSVVHAELEFAVCSEIAKGRGHFGIEKRQARGRSASNRSTLSAS